MTAHGDAAAPVVVDAPVVAATLFEDRARVVRRGRVELPAGPSRLEVHGVAPVISDASLAVALEPASARVLEARVRRRALPLRRDPGSPHEVERLEAELEALDREIDADAAALARIEVQLRSLDRLHELTAAEVAEDVTWGRVEATAWEKRFAGLGERSRRLLDWLVVSRDELAEKRRTRERLAGRIAELQNPAREEWAGVEIEVHADAPLRAELRLEYLVPGACWRPFHVATLSPDSARVTFETEACVWQSTGEDWEGARLAFSTRRASHAAEPPALTSDLLRAEPKPTEVEVEAREEEIVTAGLGAERGAASPELPGIDDGGQSVNLDAPAPASVPADGRPHRIPLVSFDADAEVDRVARPELEAAVLLRSVQTNRGHVPILAGPVDLIRAGGWAGRTSTLFVAPGERFALGWGPVPELRLQRQVDVQRDEQRLLSSWEKRHHRTTVRLSNLGPESLSVKLTERVPVSEIDKVVVKPDPGETTGGVTPDRDGFLEWTLRLAPFSHESVSLKYTLEKHQDVAGI
jgi:uncharacterized protein (TIGR02231 family)